MASGKVIIIIGAIGAGFLIWQAIKRPTVPYEIPLSAGWNDLSLPVEPKDNRLEVVLAPIEGLYDQVWHYLEDIEWWSVYVPGAPPKYYEALEAQGIAKLTTIEYGKVYNIYMLEAATLTGEGYDVGG